MQGIYLSEIPGECIWHLKDLGQPIIPDYAFQCNILQSNGFRNFLGIHNFQSFQSGMAH